MMPLQMAPQAFLFDLDGTLVDTERDNVESVVLAVGKLGVELDADERRFIVGHSWNEIHEQIARRHGLTVSMDELIASAVEEKRALMADKGFTPLPGAVAAVLRFGRRAPLAVVSGASRVEVSDAIDGLELRAHFQFLMGAEDYGRGKPDPEPYRSAIERLGVSAERCVVLEDAQPGILSARAAGARVVGIRAGNFVGYDLSAADVVVDTLDEVTDELVDRLVAGAKGMP
jgi:HAD superfamily hydrolase (TIGR01509 family)